MWKHLTFFYRYWKVYKCARSCKIIYRFRLACHRHLKRYRALTTLMDGRWRSGNELISFSLLLVDRYCLSRPERLVPFPTLMYSWPGLCSSLQWQPIEYKITENQNVVSFNLLSTLFYSPFFFLSQLLNINSVRYGFPFFPLVSNITSISWYRLIFFFFNFLSFGQAVCKHMLARGSWFKNKNAYSHVLVCMCVFYD